MSSSSSLAQDSNTSQTDNATQSPREELIGQAVRFLLDSKVQKASLAKKIAFLESKGLRADEIEESLQRSRLQQHPSSSSSYQGLSNGNQIVSSNAPPLPPPTYLHAQQSQKRHNWKDLVILSGLIGGGCASLIQIYRYFIYCNTVSSDPANPVEKLSFWSWLFPSSSSSIADKEYQLKSLKESFDEMRIQQEKRDCEVVALKDELCAIRDILPKILEQSKDGNLEVKSLKSLLLKRQLPISVSGNSSSGMESSLSVISSINSNIAPVIPSWQLSHPTKLVSSATLATKSVTTSNDNDDDDEQSVAVDNETETDGKEEEEKSASSREE